MMHVIPNELAIEIGFEEAAVACVVVRKIASEAADPQADQTPGWTRIVVSEIQALFPWREVTKIKRTLQTLVTEGLLLRTRNTHDGFDRAFWYSVPDGDGPLQRLVAMCQDEALSSVFTDGASAHHARCSSAPCSAATTYGGFDWT